MVAFTHIEMSEPMNTEKKLEYFTEIIAKETESKKREARKQMAAERNEAISQAVTKVEADANNQLETEKQSIQKSNNKQISQAKAKARRNLATLREQLTTSLFQEIKTDLITHTQTPEYETQIVNSIQAIQSQTKRIFQYIQLPPATSHLSQIIHEATGLTPEPGEESDIGGYKLLTQIRNIASDHTFKTRLQSAEEAFKESLLS